MIGSEALPFAKTGGLADVLGALPPALGAAGMGRHAWRCRGTAASPPARSSSASRSASAGTRATSASSSAAGRRRARPARRRARTSTIATALYGSRRRRTIPTTRAASRCWCARRSSSPRGAGSVPSVVHAHDWQAGLAPVYLKTLYASHPVLGGTPIVFTIHNLAYQGVFEPDWLPRLDLAWEQLGTRSHGVLGPHQLPQRRHQRRRRHHDGQPAVRGGDSDAGVRLRASTASCAAGATDLVGILNGIDTIEWDPAQRSRFCRRRTASTTWTGSGGESARCWRATACRPTNGRRAPARRHDFADGRSEGLRSDRRDVADELPRLDATFVVLGTGEPAVSGLVDAARGARHPDRIGAQIGFDEALAHLIEGGADIFLMPSRFEPCGLNQMYSLRYGTVPVVRAVGGLADTVTDYAPGDASATGFVFEDYTAAALLDALAGRWRFSATSRRGGRSRWRGCGRTIPGTVRPGSTSKYMRVRSSSRAEATGASAARR